MKKTYIRIAAMLLALLCCASVLSACGSTQSTPADTTVDTSASPDNTGDAEYTKISAGLIGVGKYYANPLAADAPDPMIIEHDGTYYLYSTGGTTLYVRTSKNLLAWTNAQQIFTLSQTEWGIDCCWAPEVHEYNGRFYLFFCGKDSKGVFHGSVAVSDTPDGTFEPITKEPLLNFDYSVIDLSFFCDDDGKTYIFYSKDCSTNQIDGKNVSQSFGVEVSSDFTSLIGEPVLCATPTLSWETKSGTTLWNEAPVIFKKNSKYYLLYSANLYSSPDYAVGYAVADSVLGPYTKPDSNCIMRGDGDDIAGPGHCNVLSVGGYDYVVYHAWTEPGNFSKGRSLYLSQLIIKEDGSLYINGPSKEKYPLPEGINGTKKYDSEDITVSASIADTTQNATYLVDGIIAKSFDGAVVFSQGDSVTFTFDTPAKLDTMWIYGSHIFGNENKTVDVIINNTYIIEGLKFSSDRGGVAIATFAKLPKGTLVESVTFTNFTSPTSKPAAITEVTFVSYEK